MKGERLSLFRDRKSPTHIYSMPNSERRGRHRREIRDETGQATRGSKELTRAINLHVLNRNTMAIPKRVETENCCRPREWISFTNGNRNSSRRREAVALFGDEDVDFLAADYVTRRLHSMCCRFLRGSGHPY